MRKSTTVGTSLWVLISLAASSGDAFSVGAAGQVGLLEANGGIFSARASCVRSQTCATVDSTQLNAKNGKNFEDETRENRRIQQQELGKQFATGEELKRLRHDLDVLRDNLQWAEAMDDHGRILDLSKAIRNGERRDPDIAYAKSLQSIAETKASTELSDNDKQVILQRLQDRAQAARSLLPRFQLEGLWVGNYGDHGEELINVTYVGDTLLASKVTGDENVPRGQITFTVDLTPRNDSSALEPLKLSLDQSSSTATKLARYAGKGQVAKRGFADHKYIDGQLVMFDKHFSFVWVPIRHHVLFRRPTPQQILSMLRDPIAREDELDNARNHLARCYEMDMTDSLARQASQDRDDDEPLRRISLTADLKSLEDRLKAAHEYQNRNSFWNAFNLSKYFDGMHDKKTKKANNPKWNRSDEQKA